MAVLTIGICGRSYEIACEDGQQDHILGLAQEVDRRGQDVLRQVGQVGEGRLLAMLCLVLQDEIAELKARPAPVPAAPADASDTAREAKVAIIDDMAELDGQVAERLEALASQVEAIADRLAKA